MSSDPTLPDAFLTALANAGLISHVLTVDPLPDPETDEAFDAEEDESTIVELLYSVVPDPVLRLADWTYALSLGDVDDVTEDTLRDLLADTLGERDLSLNSIETAAPTESTDSAQSSDMSDTLKKLQDQPDEIANRLDEKLEALEASLTERAKAMREDAERVLGDQIAPLAAFAASFEERLTAIEAALEKAKPASEAVPDHANGSMLEALEQHGARIEALGDTLSAVRETELADIQSRLEKLETQPSSADDTPELVTRLEVLEANLSSTATQLGESAQGITAQVDVLSTAAQEEVDPADRLNDSLGQIARSICSLSRNGDDGRADDATNETLLTLVEKIGELPERLESVVSTGTADDPKIDALRQMLEEHIAGQDANAEKTASTLQVLRSRPDPLSPVVVAFQSVLHRLENFATTLETESKKEAEPDTHVTALEEGLRDVAAKIDSGLSELTTGLATVQGRLEAVPDAEALLAPIEQQLASLADREAQSSSQGQSAIIEAIRNRPDPLSPIVVALQSVLHRLEPFANALETEIGTENASNTEMKELSDRVTAGLDQIQEALSALADQKTESGSEMAAADLAVLEAQITRLTPITDSFTDLLASFDERLQALSGGQAVENSLGAAGSDQFAALSEQIAALPASLQGAGDAMSIGRQSEFLQDVKMILAEFMAQLERRLSDAAGLSNSA